MAERIEAERKRIDAEWIDAFWEEDGYRLMTLLGQEPRLLTIKYCGCNVLHLAMRHNWYRLVLEILRKFKHLYKDASFLYRGFSSRSEGENPGVFQSSSTVDSQATTGDLRSRDVYGLGLASFRDLLEAKEDGGETSSRGKGAKWRYGSGLDVFAMAVIQGDAAINTLLAEAVLQVDGLFDHPHPYEDVVRFIGEGPEETGESNSSADRHVEERKLLCEMMEKCFSFPDRIDAKVNHQLEAGSEQTDAASNVSTSEQQRAADSQATSGTKQLEHPLADKIDGWTQSTKWTQEWELTSRFLPVEEFLFLACFSVHISVRNRMLEEKRIQIQHRMLKAFQQSGKGISFRKYLLGIKDTRGPALHHMVRGSSPQYLLGIKDTRGPALHHMVRGGMPHHNWIAEMVKGDEDAIENYINVHDSVGRTPLYIALALGDITKARQLLRNKATLIDSVKDTSKECGHWQFKGRIWQVDVATVSAVNHYSLDRVSDELASRALHVIMRSPHLSDSERPALTDLYTHHVRYVSFVSQLSEFPTFHSHKMTWLEWTAYVGDTGALQILANDDKIYDLSRFNNLSLPPEGIMLTDYATVLHAAAAAGHPHAIRAILATGKFDPLVKDFKGNTALHLATHFEAPLQFPHSLTDFCEIPDGRIGTSYQAESSLSTEERKDLVRMAESRRQGCINLLLQAGIDVWQTNFNEEMADPGPKASPEYSIWWYDKVSNETQEAKTSLNAAANAISVTAALVATASFVGPLQPPLGYDAQSGGLQVGVRCVQIFIVMNALAFYSSLGAIMLSLTSSLPMPQKSIMDKVKLIQYYVTLALINLISSMVAIIVAFASAYIAIVPNKSWPNRVIVSIVLIGGFVCIPYLVLCVFRLLRLSGILHDNEVKKYVYEKVHRIRYVLYLLLRR